jgi:hypothetical protein
MTAESQYVTSVRHCNCCKHASSTLLARAFLEICAAVAAFSSSCCYLSQHYCTNEQLLVACVLTRKALHHYYRQDVHALLAAPVRSEAASVNLHER